MLSLSLPRKSFFFFKVTGSLELLIAESDEFKLNNYYFRVVFLSLCFTCLRNL